MKLRIWLAGSLALVALAAWGDLRPRRDFVLTDKEAIGVMPPEVVSGGAVRSASWSFDGRFLLVLRTKEAVEPSTVKNVLAGQRPPVREQELILWDSVRRKGTTVVSAKEDSCRIGDVTWFQGSDAAIVERSWLTLREGGQMEEAPEVALLSAPSGKLRVIADHAQNLRASLSPTKALAVVSSMGSLQRPGDVVSSYQLVGPDGPLSQIVRSPKYHYGVAWSADGTAIYARGYSPKDGDVPARAFWEAIDFGAGSMSEVPRPDLFRPAQPKPAEFQPDVSQNELKLSAVSIKVSTLWLSTSDKTEFPSCMLCADASFAEMSPASDAVFYVSQGIGYVRSLVRMPKEQFLKLLEAADKTETMSRAKQVGTAMAIYAADHDDKMPIKETDMFSTLFPYTKNGDLLKGFIYTFEGGDMSKLSDPSRTELGYIPGPGGRAVIYADTSVRWISDKP